MYWLLWVCPIKRQHEYIEILETQFLIVIKGCCCLMVMAWGWLSYGCAKKCQWLVEE
jgi:hypothetical protein